MTSHVKILHKIVAGTLDEVCLQCAQYYEPEDGCRAYSVPHSDKERDARTTKYGMECDPTRVKARQYLNGVLYRTPKGVYDK